MQRTRQIYFERLLFDESWQLLRVEALDSRRSTRKLKGEAIRCWTSSIIYIYIYIYIYNVAAMGTSLTLQTKRQICIRFISAVVNIRNQHIDSWVPVQHHVQTIYPPESLSNRRLHELTNFWSNYRRIITSLFKSLRCRVRSTSDWRTHEASERPLSGDPEKRYVSTAESLNAES